MKTKSKKTHPLAAAQPRNPAVSTRIVTDISAGGRKTKIKHLVAEHKGFHPETGEPFNTDRASWAGAALVTFASHTGQLDELKTGEPHSVVQDFLCDLMHFCRINQVDFQLALNSATETHFYVEVQQEEHPQTDEHLSGCTACMMAHDKGLPDA